MTHEEVKAVYAKMEEMADSLTEYAEDVLILAIIHHDDDRPKPTRQLLDVGRGNYWARLGAAGMFFVNQSINITSPGDEDDA
jgi:hypothetical protein